MPENEEEIPQEPVEETPETPEEPEIPTESEPEAEPPKTPSNKILIFEDGTYEVGAWLHENSYPDSVLAYYIVDDGTEVGAELFQKIVNLYPYFTLTVVDGELWDVEQREKTPEEIEQENAPPPKTAEQIKIEQLEGKLAASEQSNLDTMDALFDIYLMVLELQPGGEQP